MKEIKMRAWIKDKQEMFYNVYITPRDKITDDEWEEIGIYWVDVVMLDTWLKDVNWKPIYDWDIIKTPIYMFSETPYCYENNEVVYEKWAFWIKRGRNHELLRETESVNKETEEYIPNVWTVYKDFIPKVEVIWNAYENKDLLNVWMYDN